MDISLGLLFTFLTIKNAGYGIEDLSPEGVESLRVEPPPPPLLRTTPTSFGQPLPSSDNPYLKILDFAKLLIADAIVKENTEII